MPDDLKVGDIRYFWSAVGWQKCLVVSTSYQHIETALVSRFPDGCQLAVNKSNLHTLMEAVRWRLSAWR